MLHELRHIQETSDATHNGSLAAENEAIIAHCMPGAGQEPNPTYIRAPQDPVPINPHPVTVPLDPPSFDPPSFDDPLPESDDPVLVDSDLTIIGEDGSVLEGGDVFDPNLDPDYPPSDPTGPYCAPDGCLYPDPGEPYDPGFGGGSVDPLDDWGGGGGGGGEVFHPALDDDWYWYAEEFAY